MNTQQQVSYSKELSLNGFTVLTTMTPSTISGAHTFYVSSETKPDTEYVVGTRMPESVNLLRPLPIKSVEYLCSCPDFIFREWAEYKDCKHVKVIEALVNLVGSPGVLASKLRAL